MLHTEPSFCIYSVEDGCEDEGKDEQDHQRREALERTLIEDGGFSFGKTDMGLIQEEGEEEEDGLGGLNGIQTLSVGGEVDIALPDLDDSGDAIEYYERMIDEFPSNPRVLRNYAQLLQTRGDLHGAEKYYFRAMQADPEDGEVLLKYAQLTWELHHDQCSAISYFERAAQASPEDSRILAAYARFLWETDEDEDGRSEDHIQVKETCKDEEECVDSSLHLAARLRLDGNGVTTPDSCKDGNVEEHCKRKVEDNPHSPLFLRNYAESLRSEGNLEGAEEYYSRAMLADPGMTEISACTTLSEQFKLLLGIAMFLQHMLVSYGKPGRMRKKKG